MATKNTTEGVGEKKQTNNIDLGQPQVVLWHFFVQLFVHLVDYHWECVFRETPTEATKNPNLSLTVFLTASCCSPLSTLDCQFILTGPFGCPFSTASLRLSSPTDLLQVPLTTALFSPTSGLVRDLELRPLFGFAPKQTKGSSAWCTHPHSVTKREIHI